MSKIEELKRLAEEIVAIEGTHELDITLSPDDAVILAKAVLKQQEIIEVVRAALGDIGGASKIVQEMWQLDMSNADASEMYMGASRQRRDIANAALTKVAKLEEDL